MARGDPPKRFEDLQQYFLGGRFAAAAFYERATSDPELSVQLRNYLHMVSGYLDAVKETYRLKQGGGSSSSRT